MLICGTIKLNFAKFTDIMESSGVIILFIIGFLLIVFAFVAFSSNSDDILQENEDDGSEIDVDSLIEERRLEHKARLGELIKEYGVMTTDIPLLVRGRHDLICTDSYMYVFEDSRMLVLAGESIPFSKVVSYTLADDPHTHSVQVGESQTDTSTDSMMGRALVGGMLFGSKGAMVGASTASKTTEVVTTTKQTVTHSYKIYLGLDDLSNPQRILNFGEDEKSANKATIIFDIILKRNKDQ